MFSRSIFPSNTSLKNEGCRWGCGSFAVRLSAHAEAPSQGFHPYTSPLICRVCLLNWYNKPLLPKVIRALGRWRVLWMLLLATLMSGCVQYDVGLNFSSPNRGELVQHIQIEERLTAFSNASTQQWLDSLDRRAHQLEGRTQRLSEREMIVTIPFNSGADLEEKFNEFFNPSIPDGTRSNSAELDLPDFASRLHLTHSNFFLIERDRLTYDLDLRPLGLLSSNGNVLVSPGSLFDLEFKLSTPWGARNLTPKVTSTDRTTLELSPPLEARRQGQQLIWTLKPGQLNHVDAVFWLPSPLGLGTVAIGLLVLVGSYLKYQRLPPTELTRSVLPEG